MDDLVPHGSCSGVRRWVTIPAPLTDLSGLWPGSSVYSALNQHTGSDPTFDTSVSGQTSEVFGSRPGPCVLRESFTGWVAGDASVI